MATGGHLSKSVYKSSEEAYDTCCSPCLEEGISAEAKKYCVDCGVNYCDQCLKSHGRLPGTRVHQVVDKLGPDAGSAGTALPVERCSTHHEKLVDMFCEDHESVCCSACIAVSHRTCAKVVYLPDVAKGIKKSKEYKDIHDNIDLVLAKLKAQKTKRTEKLTILDQEYERLNEEIHTSEEELKATISKLAAKSRGELNAKHAERRKQLEDDIETLETFITTLMSQVSDIENDNEARVFAKVKEGKKAVQEAETLLLSQSQSGSQESMKFDPNEYLKQLNNKLENMGVVITEKDEMQGRGDNEALEYSASLLGKYKINNYWCQVTSVCALNDGTLLLFHLKNKTLKRLNTSDFKVIDQLEMQDSSFSVCSVGSQEVAVAFYYKKTIQFVSVAGSTMTLTRSFTTDHTCRGVSFSEISGELFVGDNDRMVKVYDKTGNLLKTYQHKGAGNQLFSHSRNIACSYDYTTIFVTDGKLGLIAMDTSGTLQLVFTDPKLKSACGLCVLPGDVILVSGWGSNNVMQVDKHGKKIGTLLGADAGLTIPWALAFERKSSCLIIGQNSDEILVYKLTNKQKQ